MAQASSAQREPSMEEILASIRRIIEDSDTTPPADAEAGVRGTGAHGISSPQVRPDDQPKDEPGGAEIVEVDSFRAEFEPEFDEPVMDEPVMGEPEQPADGPAPAGLADIQAEVEARAAQLDEAELEQLAASSISEPEPADEQNGGWGVAATAHRGDDVAADAVAAAHTSAFASAHDSVSVTANAAETQAAEPTDEPDGDASRESAPAILSETTGRRVAAAFDELSDAFDASRRKSFDEMAEEMLRPMLQDWLDNNLPTLVEKLVREEIERVARGGTR